MEKKKKANNGVSWKPKKVKKVNIDEKPVVKKEIILPSPPPKPEPKPVILSTCANCTHYHVVTDDLGVCYCDGSKWASVTRRKHKTCDKWLHN